MKLAVPRLVWHPPQLFQRSLVTLSVESDSVRFLAVRGRRVTAWGLEPLEPGLVHGGAVVDPQALGAHIKSLLTSHGARSGRVVASLTGQRSMPRLLDLPETNSQLLEAMLPRELKREMPVPLDELSLAYQVISSDNGHCLVMSLSRS